jgi:diguanylate cyclase (GGDEF)-like protein
VKKIKQFFEAVLIVYREGVGAVFSDPLTGLYNRRFLEEVGPRAIELARRYHRSLSIVFLDLDDLKEINDVYGHQLGDRILQRTAQLLTNHCRKADILVRWGGDEFLFMLPETTSVEAELLIKRVMRELRAEDIRLSYGVVSWSEEYSSLEELIKKGDRLLYEHKQQKKGLRLHA